MTLLNEQQQQRAVDALREFLAAPSGPDGQTPFQAGQTCDQERVRIIEQDLKPLLASYLEGRTALSDFNLDQECPFKVSTFESEVQCCSGPPQAVSAWQALPL
jgi:hypothetical protein